MAQKSYRYGIFDVFTSSKTTNEVNELAGLANQPVQISPLVWIIPVVSVALFGIIYVAVLMKRK